MVIDLRSDGVALVDFSGLPAVQPGRVYEVWLITPTGRADAAAVFVPDSDGGKIVLVDRSLAGYSQMAITNEQGPDGIAGADAAASAVRQAGLRSALGPDRIIYTVFRRSGGNVESSSVPKAVR